MAVDTGIVGLAGEMAEIADEITALAIKVQFIQQRFMDTGAYAAASALADGATVPGTAFDKETLLNCNTGLLQFMAFMAGDAVTAFPYRRSFNTAAMLK